MAKKVLNSKDALETLLEWLREKGQEAEDSTVLLSKKADATRGVYYQIICAGPFYGVFLVYPDGTVEDVANVFAQARKEET